MVSKKGKRFDVICLGSATIDCFVRLPVDFNNIKHGSKILIDDIKLVTGGGGTNVAVGLSRLGLSAGFIGEVGDDLSADMIRQNIAKEGVNFLVKQHSRHQTAYSVVMESKGKDRSILVYKGASSYLDAHELPKSMNTNWFYFASVMGSSFKTMETVAGFARRNRIDVYLNPSSYMVEQGYGFLKKVISATTILALNKEEAQTLLKDKTGDIKRLLKGIVKLGPKIAIITDGEKGAHVYDGKEFHFRHARKMKAVDTTGAGDAFGTGFLAGFIMKKDANMKERIDFAMRLGIAEAESVIQYIGAKPGLLTKRKAFEAMK